MVGQSRHLAPARDGPGNTACTGTKPRSGQRSDRRQVFHFDWDQSINGGAVADRAAVIFSPAPNRSITFACARVPVAGTNFRDVAQSGNKRRSLRELTIAGAELTGDVESPTGDPAISQKCTRVLSAKCQHRGVANFVEENRVRVSVEATVTKLPAGVVTPAGNLTAARAHAIVRASKRNFDRVRDLGDVFRPALGFMATAAGTLSVETADSLLSLDDARAVGARVESDHLSEVFDALWGGVRIGVPIDSSAACTAVVLAHESIGFWMAGIGFVRTRSSPTLHAAVGMPDTCVRRARDDPNRSGDTDDVQGCPRLRAQKAVIAQLAFFAPPPAGESAGLAKSATMGGSKHEACSVPYALHDDGHQLVAQDSGSCFAAVVLAPTDDVTTAPSRAGPIVHGDDLDGIIESNHLDRIRPRQNCPISHLPVAIALRPTTNVAITQERTLVRRTGYHGGDRRKEWERRLRHCSRFHGGSTDVVRVAGMQVPADEMAILSAGHAGADQCDRSAHRRRVCSNGS